MAATKPRATATRCTSGMVSLDRGSPRSAGASQAIRLTSTTTLGGKAGWAPATRLSLKAAQAVAVEALTPLRDDLAWQIDPLRDRVVPEPLSREEGNLGSNDFAIR